MQRPRAGDEATAVHCVDRLLLRCLCSVHTITRGSVIHQIAFGMMSCVCVGAREMGHAFDLQKIVSAVPALQYVVACSASHSKHIEGLEVSFIG